MSPSDDVAMDDPASLPCDVSSGGDWPAGSTPGFGVDVVDQQKFVLQPFSGTSVPNPLLPILGLLFLPTTTLGYCWAAASFGGVSSFSGLLVVLIGLIIDFGLIGNGRGAVRR